MAWITLGAELVLGFTLGTVVLWVCSKTTSSPNANLKTAAIYNAIMTVVAMGIVGLALLFLAVDLGGGLFLLILLFTLVLSLVLLMWLYEVSFFVSLWLAIAMLALGALVERMVEAIL